MNTRPACYPAPSPALSADGRVALPLLDVLTSPVPQGRFDSPVDHRHVLCLHLGAPVPVSYRADRYERTGVRLHGQFCVVPAGSSTRWTLTKPATSLLLRLSPKLMDEAARSTELASLIHIRDPHIESIGWMMQAEAHNAYPGGRLFSDSLASALAARLLAVQTGAAMPEQKRAHALPQWRLRQVLEYIETNLASDLTLAELAGVAGFSLSHFKVLFREATGVPVHRFVLERRVERARMHLMQGKMSATDIALETGFTHSSHMARCLRRVLGVSTAQLRS